MHDYIAGISKITAKDIRKFIENPTYVCTAVFVLVTIISTIHSAMIDKGSWVLYDPHKESGHYMTTGEAILHNFPPAVIEGLFFAAIIFTGYWLYRKYKEYSKEANL